MITKTPKIGSYEWFILVCRENGWTLADVRCDVPPTEEILALMDEMSLRRWERYVARLQKTPESLL